jgi:uncharacterized protein DUF6600
MTIMPAPSLPRLALRIAATSFAALAAVLLAVCALAQAVDDAPTRVGRVAGVQGTLYHTPAAGVQEWLPAGLNEPVAQGDDLWVDDDSRAEVDYGGGQFRIEGRTNLHVSRLDEGQLALFVASGHLIVRVRYLDAGDTVRIDTPSSQIGLARPGLYRVDVEANPAQTRLVVREGLAEVATANGSEAVYPGEVAMLEGTSDVAADIQPGGGLDAFDTWSAERDRVYEGRPYQYVSPEMVGSYDLDTYGTWQTYPDYGAVWFPTVDPEWAPYRFGHWTWLRDYGYAWVDNAPWGYAPFHYGRWAYLDGRWGWCPGAYVRRPAWSPALVVWYGGASWNYTAGNGAPVFGWVPLGWGEAYVPWWRGCSARCYTRYNRPYGIDVARRVAEPPSRPVNWRAPGGVTAVPAGTLATGRPVAINRVPIATNRPVAPPPLSAPPTVAPVVARPGTVRPGGAVPPPAGVFARTPPAASLPARAPAAPPASGGRASVPAVRPAPATPLRPVPPASAERGLPLPQTSSGVPSAPPRPVPAIPEQRSAPLRPAPTPPAAPAPLRVPAMPAPPMAPQAPVVRSAPVIPQAPLVPQVPIVPQPPVAPPRVAPPPPAAPAPVRPAPAPGPVAPPPAPGGS